MSTNSTKVSTGTRNPSQTPFASTSVFNLPLGLNAQWQYNQQLASANFFVNTVGNYNENIWTGTASDPLVTVTNTAAAGGEPGTFQVHIPNGAIAAAGGDQTFSVDDTTSHTWYSFGGFNWTGNNTATVSQGSGESDFGSGLMVDNSDWDEGVGTLRQNDLQAGTIDHMLRIEIPTTMAMSYSQSSTNSLAPYAWPQTAEDGFAINGNGGPPYTGTVPFGATIGIPASAVEPADIAANPGANLLWKAMQDHGAMIRDTGGSGNTVIIQADQDVDPNDPLIQGMDQYGGEILAAAQILTNQGPNSINGGGTPIVPLDPAPSDAPTPTPTPTPTPAPAPSANDTVVRAGSTAAIIDASGNKWTLTSSNLVAVNGSADMSTANVTELAYVNGTIWQENANNLWWGKTSPGASWTPGNGTPVSPLPPTPTPTPTPPPPTPTPISKPSPNDTVVLPGSAAAIVDTSGNKWTITAGGQVAINGKADTTTANVVELAYVGGKIWQQNSARLWWGETSPTAGWSPNAGTATSPLPAPVATASLSGTVVLAGSSAALSDAAGNAWRITAGGQIAVNGVVDGTTGNVTEIALVKGQIWQENSANLWWGKTSPTAAWSPNFGTAVSPLPAMPVAVPAPVLTATTLAIASAQASATVSQSNISVLATAGAHMVFVTGSGDTLTLGGGTETITDTGGHNTYAIPAAGKGMLTFSSGFLQSSDTLDLRPTLAGGHWNGSGTTIGSFLHVTDTAQGATLSVAATAGGSLTAVANFAGATTANLSTILAHALT